MKNDLQDLLQKTVSGPSGYEERVVEIFKIDIANDFEANWIVHLLRKYFPTCRINIDLYNPEKILRVEGHGREINIPLILKHVKELSYNIEWINE